ncbi:MAG: hypothetical protein BJ554DRAFT_2021 [Olpidium bornovanus]|uniref:Uncharacterized protein n=1 Tax=Olpidium bornovanus TaxID=278681 RepID=A0A8H8A1P2_9FUNG|nr:MAG: hypothetical protein BJ554DRAFT_2021 [Olpidium bornovanus]
MTGGCGSRSAADPPPETRTLRRLLEARAALDELLRGAAALLAALADAAAGAGPALDLGRVSALKAECDAASEKLAAALEDVETPAEREATPARFPVMRDSCVLTPAPLRPPPSLSPRLTRKRSGSLRPRPVSSDRREEGPGGQSGAEALPGPAVAGDGFPDVHRGPAGAPDRSSRSSRLGAAAGGAPAGPPNVRTVNMEA